MNNKENQLLGQVCREAYEDETVRMENAVESLKKMGYDGIRHYEPEIKLCANGFQVITPIYLVRDYSFLGEKYFCRTTNRWRR